MYEALVARVRYHIQKANFMGLKDAESTLLLGEAADAIEVLSKLALDEHNRAAKLAWESRWIPVTELLIHSGWYLVACNEWGGSAVRKAIYDEATRKWLEFPCGGPKDITKFVTHYMPLPQPPKEE